MKVRLLLPSLLFAAAATTACGESPARPTRDLNGYFPFQPVADADAWKSRHDEIQKRILLASGLWPMPEKTPLNAVVHELERRHAAKP